MSARTRSESRVVAITKSLVLCLSLGSATTPFAQSDPGPRAGAAGAGGKFSTLNSNETAFFNAARVRFQEVDSVSGTIEAGNGTAHFLRARRPRHA